MKELHILAPTNIPNSNLESLLRGLHNLTYLAVSHISSSQISALPKSLKTLLLSEPALGDEHEHLSEVLSSLLSFVKVSNQSLQTLHITNLSMNGIESLQDSLVSQLGYRMVEIEEAGVSVCIQNVSRVPDLYIFDSFLSAVPGSVSSSFKTVTFDSTTTVGIIEPITVELNGMARLVECCSNLTGGYFLNGLLHATCRILF